MLGSYTGDVCEEVAIFLVMIMLYLYLKHLGKLGLCNKVLFQDVAKILL